MCIGYAMKHFLNIGDDDSICRLEFYVTKSIGNVTAELNKYWRKYRSSPKFKENPKWHDEFSKEKTIIICIRNSVWIVWWNWLIERFQNNKLKKNSLYIIAFDVVARLQSDMLCWRNTRFIMKNWHFVFVVVVVVLFDFMFSFNCESMNGLCIFRFVLLILWFWIKEFISMSNQTNK